MDKKYRIIAYDLSGQMCNHLGFIANLAASAIEYSFEVKVYDNKYRNCIKGSGLSFFKIKRNSISIFYYKFLAKILPQRVLMLSNNIFNVTFYFEKIEKGDYILSGYPYFDFDSIRKHSDKVKKMLQPPDKVMRCCVNKITQYRQENFFLIAVHIRRGDYRTYNEGKFFYSDDTYVEKCLQVQKLVKNEIHKNICYLLFSDEKIELEHYKELGKVVWDSNGKAVYDVYSMSLCDMIIGPHSTFSEWASFWGNTPCFWIGRNDENIESLEQFRIGFDLELDGK